MSGPPPTQDQAAAAGEPVSLGELSIAGGRTCRVNAGP